MLLQALKGNLYGLLGKDYLNSILKQFIILKAYEVLYIISF